MEQPEANKKIIRKPYQKQKVLEKMLTTSNTQNNYQPEEPQDVMEYESNIFKGFTSLFNDSVSNSEEVVSRVSPPPDIYQPIDFSQPFQISDYVDLSLLNETLLACLHDNAPSAQSDKKKVFRCDECNKILTTKKGLKKHIDTKHKHLKPHTCDECGDKFAEAGNLNRHMHLIHYGTTRYTCDQCDFKCYTNDDIKRHLFSKHTIK